MSEFGSLRKLSPDGVRMGLLDPSQKEVLRFAVSCRVLTLVLQVSLEPSPERALAMPELGLKSKWSSSPLLGVPQHVVEPMLRRSEREP